MALEVVGLGSDLLIGEPFQLMVKADGYDLHVTSMDEQDRYGVKDFVYELAIKEGVGEALGTATVTLRQVPTADWFVFVEVESFEDEIELTLQHSLDGHASKTWELDSPTEEVYPERKERTLPDPTTNSFHYVEFAEADGVSGSVLIGGQYQFQELLHTYDDLHDKTSHVYELIREMDQFVVAEDGEGVRLDVTTAAEAGMGHSWYLLSEAALFSNEEAFKRAQHIGIDEYKWLTPTDVLSKAPSTIFPYHEQGFVRSLVRQGAKKSLLELEASGCRFFESVNWNSFVQLESIRDDDGLWYSNYTSTWLERKYGIVTHYVDSRHNDNLFRNQERRARNLEIEEYRDEYLVYADFLVQKFEEGFVVETDNGAILVDYFSDDGEALPHASLNHALSLMNYLYDAYLKSGNEAYRMVADTMLRGIVDIGEDWIAPDGHVYYQLNQDGTLQSEDYRLVTYYDLLYTKKLLEEIKGSTEPLVDTLIEVKRAHLEEQELDWDVDVEHIEDYVGVIE
ncbi:hypothetical protein LQ50_19730 [Halalkalibacter okhensis]|uniref:D-glucuronyl C5-epimerase C-terminal domain-containing protein n=1 Tax=Halalkalibacter okhensis TaxID=333138 RepID=A0A0B0IF60_9BACI|nr:hypothetical protein LQ50_19730 [Halalkalibacter okhensis]